MKVLVQRIGIMLSSFLLVQQLVAQTDTYKVDYESPSTILQGEDYAYKVQVRGANKEQMLSIWEKQTKKVSEDKPVLEGTDYTKPVILKKISSKPLNMKYTAVDVTGGARFGVMLKDSVGAFTSSRHQADLVIQNFLKEYAIAVYAEVLENEISVLENAISDEEKLLSKRHKEQDKIKGNQEKLRQEIEQEKITIKHNEGEAARILSELNELKTKQASTTDKETLKMLKDNIKDKEKLHKSTLKSIEDGHEEIFSIEAEIRAEETNLGLEKKKAEAIQARIEEKHKELVSKQAELAQLEG